MTMGIQVQQEGQKAIDILVRAFHDDPVMLWMSGHPDFLRTFFDITLPVFLPHGLTYIEAQGRGAAAWLGPHQKLQWPVTAGNLWRMFRVCGVRGFFRFGRGGLATARFHPGEPHYYLFLIGALPECKGQGVGSALIAHVLRKCDEENLPAYLENSKQDNLAFYRGHGFEVVDQIRFARNAPPVWLMWREPRPQG
ncbi:MAG: GNAT family N-acetyltransferase [Halioglobus sp.]|nr:GNAT family N-acetyltransferase [Halioglobus sp.]